MTELEQLQVEVNQIQQIVDSPAWAVITKRLKSGIDLYVERTLNAPTWETSIAFRERVKVYRELLELPSLIADEFKQEAKSTTEAE